MCALNIYGKDCIDQLLHRREGETKLGECVQTATGTGEGWEQELAESEASFVLIGICEDAGVRANGGIGGAGSAWMPFLKAFLNIQHNRFLQGTSFFLLGAFSWEDKEDSTDFLRTATAAIDNMVFPVIQKVIAAGKMPLVIGGGHNNAYPLLRGAATALDRKVNALNLDAHADFRAEEGRHSGNGFRYAYSGGFLAKYAMLGLHEAYNNSAIIAAAESEKDLLPVYWEDIFLRGRISWEEAIRRALEHVGKAPFGVELDADCIENVLSSAMTPVGLTAQQAMKYLYECGKAPDAIYLHLPEAVSERSDGLESPLSGKMLSYLVQAFVKGVNDR